METETEAEAGRGVCQSNSDVFNFNSNGTNPCRTLLTTGRNDDEELSHFWTFGALEELSVTLGF